MVRGLTTVSFWADDLTAAKQWYSELLGIAPYFERPGYIEFRLGDYQHELGIIDRRYAPDSAATNPAGAIVYWHVDDVKATFDKLLAMGAHIHQDLIERGVNGVEDGCPFGRSVDRA